jgi:DNA-binding transcriptional regulator YiaG
MSCALTFSEPTQSVSHKTKTIQERMKAWRLINGLSVEKAASIAGCTNEAWRDWEGGAHVSHPWEKHLGNVIQNLV